MVAQLHAPSPQQNKHLLSVQFSQREQAAQCTILFEGSGSASSESAPENMKLPTIAPDNML